MPTQEEVNSYLNALRRSGATNMFGTAPYVEKHFKIDRNTARKMVTSWMVSFSGDEQ